MQERKRLEQAIANEAEVARLTSDLDTLFELGREGEDVASGSGARDQELSPSAWKSLETEMLLSGPNDSKSAILVIHPGAGGTESQDWAEMLLRMYLRWAERHGQQAVVTDRLEGEGRGHQIGHRRNQRRECLRPAAIGDRRAPAGAHLALRRQRAAPYFVRIGVRLSANRRRHQHRHQARGFARGCISRHRAPAASTSTGPSRPCA